MDPHSRYSPFNNQVGRPKTGPELQSIRGVKMELKTTAVLDQFRKSDSAFERKGQSELFVLLFDNYR